MDIVRNKEIENFDTLDQDIRGDAIVGSQFDSLSYMYDTQAAQPVLTLKFLGPLGQADIDHVDILLTNFVDIPNAYTVTIGKLEKIDSFYRNLVRKFAAENSAIGIRTIPGETKRVADLFRDFVFYMEAYDYHAAFVYYAAITYRSTIFTEERWQWFGDELHNYIFSSDFVAANYPAHEGV